MMRHYWPLILALTSVFSVKAQDPSFSQFYVNKVYLNPATTGSESGLSIAAIYRNQWSKIPGAFHTTGFAVDVQMPRFSSGFGVNGYYDNAANGLLRNINLGFSYAYIIKILKNFNIHIGLQATYFRKSLDGSRLVFSDQLDPFLGNINPTSAVVPNESISVFDLGSGILGRFSIPIGRSEIHNSIGFAVFHLTEPSESFLSLETKLPRRYTVHYGMMIPIKDNIAKKRSSFYISPVFKFDYQENLSIFTIGFLTMVRPLFMGVLYQDNKFNQTDSKTMIFTGGTDFEIDNINFTFGYSYDLNMTGITNVSGGVHELAFKVRFLDAVRYRNKSKPKKVKCYEFNGKNAIKLF